MRTLTVSPVTHFLLADERAALVWLLVRIYLGWQWLEAGWGKLHSAVWVGDKAGTAISGFVQGALHKTAQYCSDAANCHPDVQDWYASFLQHAVASHPLIWSYAVSYGELLVGIALILGFLVGISAFFGIFMNLNYLLAGTVSVNPIWFVLGLSLVLAWRIAGWYGADRFVLPLVRRWSDARRTS